MKKILTALLCAFFAFASSTLANTPPTATVISATMRASTGIMDVVYRINDPDNPTVKVRALAFVNGSRSFSNVLRPVTFVEGTASNLGDAITTNVNHTLSWNVGADWNISLGNVKFEILARDGRGLLAFDWISIPAVPGHAAVSVSKDTPSNSAALDAFFWLYAAADPGLTFANGLLTGTPSSGVFAGIPLVSGTTLQSYAVPYLFKQGNLDFAPLEDVSYATAARSSILNPSKWHAANRNWAGITPPIGWGSNSNGQTNFPVGLSSAIAIATGEYHNLAINSGGGVIAWGWNDYGQSNVPADLTDVIAIAATRHNGLALKRNGTIVSWGYNGEGQNNTAAITGVTAIAGGRYYSLALKQDGSVVGWGRNDPGVRVPAGLTGVIAISARDNHSMALKSDGTIVDWGSIVQTQIIPNVTAIAAGSSHSLALKSDGTVIGWGSNSSGQTTIPAGLTGVIAIAAGASHSLALKGDGTIIGWGSNTSGQTTIPPGLTGVIAISAGESHSLALKPLAQ